MEAIFHCILEAFIIMRKLRNSEILDNYLCVEFLFGIEVSLSLFQFTANLNSCLKNKICQIKDNFIIYTMNNLIELLIAFVKCLF